MDKYELFDKYIIGELTDSETDALMELLQDDETGREFVEYTMETKLFVDYGKKVKSRINISNTTRKSRAVKKKRSSVLPMLAVAALLCLAFLGYSYFSQKNSVEVSSKGRIEVIRDGVKVKVAGAVKEGDFIKVADSSTLTFEDGSMMELNSGTELTVQEAVLNKVIFLSKGKVSLNVEKQKIGVVRVITEDSVTEVMGTKFTVDKLRVGTLLEVESGKVKFSNDKESIEVTKGTLVYTDSEKGMMSLPAEGVNSRWRLWNMLNAGDENLHFYTDFLEGEFKGELLEGSIKQDQYGSYLSHGVLFLDNSKDFNIGRKFTLFAWVRMHAPSVHAPILTKGDNAWRMQINKGAPHGGFGVKSQESYFDINYKLEENQWYMLHQVFDNGLVKTYVNGSLMDERTVQGINLENQEPILLGGNSHKPTFIFPGDIGEAGIYTKALTDEEIAEMFQVGKYFTK